MDRLATLRQFVADQPGDPFPRYGLAMELRNQDRPEEAWAEFRGLIESFPDYVPAYLMAGGTLVTLDRRQEAAEVYRAGIEAAGRASDGHAASELREALAEIDPTA
jgi:predicted Zn-dependent protease